MRVHRNAKTTPKMRQLIVTRAEQGWTYGRIAAALGISVRTVAKWRARSRQAAGLSDGSSRPHRQPRGEIGAAPPLDLAQRRVGGGGFGRELQPGDEVGEGGEIREHHRRVGAGFVLAAQLVEGGGHVAAHHGFEQVEDASPVGQAEHVAHAVVASAISPDLSAAPKVDEARRMQP